MITSRCVLLHAKLNYNYRTNSYHEDYGGLNRNGDFFLLLLILDSKWVELLRMRSHVWVGVALLDKSGSVKLVFEVL